MTQCCAHRAVQIGLMGLILTGCQAGYGHFIAGSSSQSQAVGFTAKSWILRNSKNGSLLYVTDGSSDVAIYSYPKGKLVGTLTGFGLAKGVCTDSHQDVFITDSALHQIVEYAHGGSTPIATITEDAGNNPLACSVDPQTNNLAVANELPGDVAVFQNAQGQPTTYTYGQADFWGCVYDGNSNLYVSGYSNNFILELPHGSDSLTKISVAKLAHGGSLAWDGQYLALNDLPRRHAATNIARINVQGSVGSIVDTVALHTSKKGQLSSYAQYWIEGGTIVGAVGINRGGVGIGYWHYPNGGRAFKVIKTEASIIGAAVSNAP